MLQLLQSWFLPSLTRWTHAIGELIGNDYLQQIDLAHSIELIFGIILVVMMLFRRDGLIPATRKTAALRFEAQHVPRCGAAASSEAGRAMLGDCRSAAAIFWKFAA